MADRFQAVPLLLDLIVAAPEALKMESCATLVTLSYDATNQREMVEKYSNATVFLDASTPSRRPLPS